VVFNAFDLVIFDCPPRVTTSVVNAMLCSDFVLIPTRLDRGSIDAVPRTLDWMKKFGPLCPASVVGVVASHVVLRSGRPTKADAQSFELLKTAVESQYGEGLVLKAIVPASTSAVSHDPGVVASVGREGRAVFEPVVAELRARMKI
jgi:cellulose biosynthesis protein BcsQ